MKIIDVLNYYYSMFPILDLCVEMNGGINGRTYTYTKEEALNFLNGWENETVVRITFTTHYFFCGEATREKERPHLYIMFLHSGE